MAAELIPVVKSIYLCDDFQPDSLSGKINMFGVFDAFRPSVSVPPFVLGRLCVVAQLIGGNGDTPVNVEIIDPIDGSLVLSSTTQTIRFPTRHTTVYLCVRLQNCRFPKAGLYLIELYARGQFLDDRRIRIVAPKEFNHGPNGTSA
jgi:hypothetical protein